MKTQEQKCDEILLLKRMPAQKSYAGELFK